MLKWIILLGTLAMLPFFTHMQEALDDFEVPVEITTKRKRFAAPSPLSLKKTVGRTRKTEKYVYAEGANSGEVNITLKGTMSDQYCCFWINQKHPAVPETWKHLKEYPFDFLFNGVFVKNMRDNSERKTHSHHSFGKNIKNDL